MVDPTAPADRSLRRRLRGLYFDRTATAFRFRLTLLAIDIVTVLYFVASTFFPHQQYLHLIDAAIGTFYLAELMARVYIDPHPYKLIFYPASLLDMVVIASLFAPAFIGNLLFLRLIRTLRLIHSYNLLEELRANSEYVRRHVEVIVATTNLIVFLFVATAFVYLLQKDTNQAIETYLDALYFAIATLTTTGYGDVTLVGPEGRLLSIVMMVAGITLFFNLVRAVARSARRRGATKVVIAPTHCPHCGGSLEEFHKDPQ